MNIFTVNAFGGYGNNWVHDNMMLLITIFIGIFFIVTILSVWLIKDPTFKYLLPAFLSVFVIFGVIGVSLNDKNYSLNHKAIIHKIERDYNLTYIDDPASVNNYQFGFTVIDNRNGDPINCKIRPVKTSDYHEYTGELNCSQTVEVHLNPKSTRHHRG